MKHSSRKVLVLIVLLFLSSFFALQAVALQLALLTMNDGLELLQKWSPLIRYIEETAALDINLVLVNNHHAMEKGLNDKFYDVGYVNSLWEEQMVASNSQLNTRARAVIKNSNTFETAIIVNVSSIMRSLHELRGKYFALTVENESFCGYYVPLCMLAQAGLDIHDRFDQIIYSGTFESILKGVAYGAVDAGAVSSCTLFDPSMREYREAVRVLAISQPIEQWALIAQNSVKVALINRFFDVLMHMHEHSVGIMLLENAGFTKFGEIDKKNFDDEDIYLSCYKEGAYAFAK